MSDYAFHRYVHPALYRMWRASIHAQAAYASKVPSRNFQYYRRALEDMHRELVRQDIHFLVARLDWTPNPQTWSAGYDRGHDLARIDMRHRIAEMLGETNV